MNQITSGTGLQICQALYYGDIYDYGTGRRNWQPVHRVANSRPPWTSSPAVTISTRLRVMTTAARWARTASASLARQLCLYPGCHLHATGVGLTRTTAPATRTKY